MKKHWMAILIALLSSLFYGGFVAFGMLAAYTPIHFFEYYSSILSVAFGLALVVLASIVMLQPRVIWKRVFAILQFVVALVCLTIFIYDQANPTSPQEHGWGRTLQYLQGKLIWQQGVAEIAQQLETEGDHFSTILASSLSPYYRARVSTISEGVLKGYWGTLDTAVFDSLLQKEFLRDNMESYHSVLAAYALDSLHRLDLAEMLLRNGSMPEDFGSNSLYREEQRGLVHRAAQLYSVYTRFGKLEIDKAAFLSILEVNGLALESPLNGHTILEELQSRLAGDSGTTMDLRKLGLCTLPENLPSFFKVKKILVDGNHLSSSANWVSAWNSWLAQNWQKVQVPAESYCFDQLFKGSDLTSYYLSNPASSKNPNPPKVGEKWEVAPMVLPYWGSANLAGTAKGWLSRGDVLKIKELVNNGALAKFVGIHNEEEDLNVACEDGKESCYVPTSYLVPANNKIPSISTDAQLLQASKGDPSRETLALEAYVASSKEYFATLQLSDMTALPHESVCKYLHNLSSDDGLQNSFTFSGPYIGSNLLQHSVAALDSLPDGVVFPKVGKSFFKEDRDVIEEPGYAAAFLAFLYSNHRNYWYELQGGTPEEAVAEQESETDEDVDQNTESENEDEEYEEGDEGEDAPPSLDLCGYELVTFHLDVEEADQVAKPIIAVRIVQNNGGDYSLQEDTLTVVSSAIFEQSSNDVSADFAYKLGTERIYNLGGKVVSTFLVTHSIDMSKADIQGQGDALQLDLNGDGVFDLYLSNASAAGVSYANINGQWKQIGYPLEASEYENEGD